MADLRSHRLARRLVLGLAVVVIALAVVGSVLIALEFLRQP
ncbi:hypothetical protein [Aureimonas jatrophae]|jgi:hypothetical protein|uniref:Uncharacterized protein n=1 Tax=Aureimonas jatrophae TaxID=1166073 RepID=A0A1H0F956_9HYPH|nr:hypothetical protein [Aureimonas jatrophae]MBB3950122.1 hypothetical protein [Aureimonas jatrophae]SDN91130.1 hypothetical protein SAMN05192530_102414 [Aureimonas jatrophae]